MLDLYEFGEELKKYNYSVFSGVPCSLLTPLLNYAINEFAYIIAPSESDAVAIASGAFLAGKKSIVLMQNSGLANAVSALTSLTYIFRIPLLGFVSLRGEEGLEDEPQHELMGQITSDLLSLMKIEWAFLDSNLESVKKQLDIANKAIEEGKSFFFIVRKNLFEKDVIFNSTPLIHSCNQKRYDSKAFDTHPSGIDALKIISNFSGNESITIASTGFMGRQLYELEDKPNNFYMVGSMGCASSLGLGIALNTNKEVIVVDGDGALIMRMGNLAVCGYYSPDNMFHILLDNNSYDSTGGQLTVSSVINFPTLAESSNYKHIYHVHSLEELREALWFWRSHKGLTFIYLKTSKISKESRQLLGRPNIKPYEQKERLALLLNNK